MTNKKHSLPSGGLWLSRESYTPRQYEHCLLSRWPAANVETSKATEVGLAPHT